MRAKKRRPRAAREQPSEQAPRINRSSSTLSLREQLKLAKATTQEEAPPRVVNRTKFRRKKDPLSRVPGPDLGDAPDGKYSLQKDPVIYIDGYNVIGAWPRLRKWRDRHDMETARRLLVADIAEYSHVRGWDCVCVFDANGTEQETNVERTPENVTVVFTGSETADTYIERCVFQRCEANDRQVWAATSDVAQLSFSHAKGAHVMSSHLFVQEIKRARKETRERIGEFDEASAQGKMLIANVDKSTRDRLYQLRDRLDAG